jgi:hypothetical protein
LRESGVGSRESAETLSGGGAKADSESLLDFFDESFRLPTPTEFPACAAHTSP